MQHIQYEEIFIAIICNLHQLQWSQIKSLKVAIGTTEHKLQYFSDV